MRQPDPKLHQQISFVKSACRVIAGALLINQRFISAGLMIILAEVLGIIEELV
jgi:hypothetical protein